MLSDIALRHSQRSHSWTTSLHITYFPKPESVLSLQTNCRVYPIYSQQFVVRFGDEVLFCNRSPSFQIRHAHDWYRLHHSLHLWGHFCLSFHFLTYISRMMALFIAAKDAWSIQCLLIGYAMNVHVVMDAFAGVHRHCSHNFFKVLWLLGLKWPFPVSCKEYLLCTHITDCGDINQSILRFYGNFAARPWGFSSSAPLDLIVVYHCGCLKEKYKICPKTIVWKSGKVRRSHLQ